MVTFGVGFDGLVDATRAVFVIVVVVVVVVVVVDVFKLMVVGVAAVVGVIFVDVVIDAIMLGAVPIKKCGNIIGSLLRLLLSII